MCTVSVRSTSVAVRNYSFFKKFKKNGKSYFYVSFTVYESLKIIVERNFFKIICCRNFVLVFKVIKSFVRHIHFH